MDKKTTLLLKVFLHILIWFLIYFLIFLYISSFRSEFFWGYHLLTLCIYAIVFYCNFYLLMPFLFKKKIGLYILFTFILLSGTFLVKNGLSRHNFENRIFHKEGFSPFPHEVEPFYFNPHKAKAPFARPPRDKRILFVFQGILVFYSISVSLRLIKKWQDDESLKSNLEKEKIQTELNFLKQQINPHFLFNSLNSIYSLSLSKSDVATNSILKLSAILRYTLYESDNSKVALKDEIQIIKDYIDLQLLRTNNKVRVDFQIVGEAEELQIESFIFLPLVENAFKYGSDNVNDSFIQFIVTIYSNKIEFRSSNKIVVTNIKKDKNSGIGLKNVKRRLDLLYKDKHKLEIEGSENIFLVLLQIKI